MISHITYSKIQQVSENNLYFPYPSPFYKCLHHFSMVKTNRVVIKCQSQYIFLKRVYKIKIHKKYENLKFLILILCFLLVILLIFFIYFITIYGYIEMSTMSMKIYYSIRSSCIFSFFSIIFSMKKSQKYHQETFVSLNNLFQKLYTIPKKTFDVPKAWYNITFHQKHMKKYLEVEVIL